MAKICCICGKEFVGEGITCEACLSNEEACAKHLNEIEDGAQTNSVIASFLNSLDERALLSDVNENEVPHSIEDCTRNDIMTDKLWSWARTFEKLGQIFFILIVIGGCAVSIWSASIVNQYTDKKTFSFTAFLGGIEKYAIYAVIEFIAYRIITLLIASLARIVQSTHTTARLAEYSARKQEQ